MKAGNMTSGYEFLNGDGRGELYEAFACGRIRSRVPGDTVLLLGCIVSKPFEATGSRN